jgi:nucleotide-binding universal stress UspA family protein
MNTYPSLEIPASKPSEETHRSGTQGQKILVPIDFSPESVAALRSAASTAARTNARLTLLHIVESGVVFRGSEVPASHRKLQELNGVRMEELVEQELPPSISAEVIVTSGDPATEIVSIAAERDIDCILVGEHHHHGWRRWWGGHTAQKVAKSAACEVILATEHADRAVALG